MDQRVNILKSLLNLPDQTFATPTLVNDLTRFLFNHTDQKLSLESVQDLCKLCYTQDRLDLLNNVLQYSVTCNNSLDNNGLLESNPQVPYIHSPRTIDTHPPLYDIADTPQLKPPPINPQEFITDVFSIQLKMKNGSIYRPKSLQVYEGSLRRLLDTPNGTNINSSSFEEMAEFFHINSQNQSELKRYENFISAIFTVINNFNSNQLFIDKHFGSSLNFQRFVDKCTKIHCQLKAASTEITQFSFQHLTDDELIHYRPWTDINASVLKYITPFIDTPLDSFSELELQTAAFLSLNVIDNPPRRNDFVFLHALPDDTDYLTNNIYDHNGVLLNHFKTVRSFGPYHFIPSPLTRRILDQLLLIRQQQQRRFFFIDDEKIVEIDKLNATNVFRKYFQIASLPLTSRVLRISYITHLKETGKLTYFKEQVELSVKMAHSVYMQNVIYARRPHQPTSTTLTPINTIDTNPTHNDLLPEISRKRKRADKHPFPKNALNHLNNILHQLFAENLLFDSHNKVNWLLVRSRLLLLDNNFSQYTTQHIQIKAINEKIKLSNNNYDLLWFGIVPLTSSAAKRLKNSAHAPSIPPILPSQTVLSTDVNL
jgi:hypothetical protein